MMCVVNFALPSHSSRVLSGDGLVGGNPTMNTNTPRLRKGGRIASSSSLVSLVLVLLHINSLFCL